ncbi:MAG: hypothetical protein ABIV63_12710, partial [Caldimonas sp.]
MELTSPSGLRAVFHEHGALQTLAFDDIVVNLFVGNALEGGPANVILRRHGAAIEHVLLLGPQSPTRWRGAAEGRGLDGAGEWQGLRYRIAFRLAADAPAWFWHVHVENTGPAPARLDLMLLQDLALAPYAAVRMNEYYVSQYIDHTPLAHAERGTVLAARQNQAVGTRTPWCAIGSLNRAVGHATDALQVHGLAARAGMPAPGLANGLPSTRLQHEHAMAALQDAPFDLAPGASVERGWFGALQADHPASTSPADLAFVDRTLALPEARPPTWQDDASAAATATATASSTAPTSAANLFTTAPRLDALDLDDAALDAVFGPGRRDVERDDAGSVLGFFVGPNRHVATRAKELKVLRPHGRVLRTGTLLLPDESALTSTAWMAGVFHSMLTQGHVSINRCLSTVRSYIGLFRSQGLRVFVEIDGDWQLLDEPSAFEMWPDGCRWVYRHAGGRIDVRSQAHADPHAFGLDVDIVEGAAVRCLLCLHVALNGDDGSTPGRVRSWRDGPAVVFAPTPDSELGKRFPHGDWRIEPGRETTIEQVGGDEALFADGRSRDVPCLTLATAPARAARFRLIGRFVTSGPDVPAADTPDAVSGRLGADVRVE